MPEPLPILNNSPDRGADSGEGAVRPHKGAAIQLDPRTYDRALACVHCGLCLPACPTYLETGNENDSPRGRIQLIRGLADAQIYPDKSVRSHLDLCLDCRGCETACPSGVVYHELIEEVRDKLGKREPQDWGQKFFRWILFNVMTHPTRLKVALLPARVLQKLRLFEGLRRLRVFELLPPQYRKMVDMLNDEGPLWPAALPEHSGDGGMDAVLLALHKTATRGRGAESQTKRRMKIGFLGGCINGVMFDNVNRQAIDLLVAADVDVEAPRAQGCCGAIHRHGGARSEAEALARRNIDAFLPLEGEQVDFIVTTIAGCGAMLREYPLLLRDDPAYAERAAAFAERVRDISELLVELPLPELKYPINTIVTYHDACHLAHAQKVTAAPRALLEKIPGLVVVPLAESDICCGAAGSYNLTQPEMANQLADRKLANIAATEAEYCVTGNAGCSLHIQSQARARGQKIKIIHPVQLVHQAIFG